MARYNIELRTADRVWETHIVERDDVTGLRIEMAKFVGDLLKDHADRIWMDQEWRVDVTNAEGLILFVMEISVSDTAATMLLKR